METCDPHAIEDAHQVSPNVLTSMNPSYELKPYYLYMQVPFITIHLCQMCSDTQIMSGGLILRPAIISSHNASRCILDV